MAEYSTSSKSYVLSYLQVVLYDEMSSLVSRVLKHFAVLASINQQSKLRALRPCCFYYFFNSLRLRHTFIRDISYHSFVHVYTLYTQICFVKNLSVKYF